jgi:hypothetical protein
LYSSPQSGKARFAAQSLRKAHGHDGLGKSGGWISNIPALRCSISEVRLANNHRILHVTRDYAHRYAEGQRIRCFSGTTRLD